MEFFQQSPKLNVFLVDIKNYLDPRWSDDRDEFISHLRNIPDVDNIFKGLVRQNQKWIELAQSVPPQFFLDKVKVDEEHYKPDLLSLCIFDSGTQPVIKVRVCVIR